MNSAISANTQAIQDIESDISTHTSDTTIHITSTERATWNGKQDALTFDSAPTANSANVLASGTIKAALDQKQASLTFDQVPTANSQNVLSSGAIHTALSGKVNTSDTIAINHGGTGATTAAGARTNLGLGTAAQKDATSSVASDNDDLVTSGAVFSKLAEYQEALTFDSTPTANSENPVTSRGIKTALDAKQDTLTFDSVPTKNSSNVVSSGAIRDALDEKQDIMTLDPSPQQDSTNGVTSGGVYAALQAHTYTLPQASASVLGGVKIGNNLSIDENGVLSAIAEPYSLPTAGANTLGGVKIGNNLSIDENGVLSAIAEPYSLPTASSSVLGGIMVGSNLTILNGVLSAQSIDIPNGNHATIQSSNVASKAYAVGEFLVLKSNGKLYRVTQAIGSGVQITVGTNVVATTDGAEITKINTLLSHPDQIARDGYIGRRIEGGGIIFFDYAIGFKGSVTVAPKSNLNTYHVNAAGVVVKDTTNANDRFYVVQDKDLVSTKDGDALMWSNGTTGTLYTAIGTETGFGKGLSNTQKCIDAASTDGLLEWNTNAYKCIWHYLWKGDYQYRSPKWFVPSKDELNVLLNMQWQVASNRKSYDGETQLAQLPMSFSPYYWSSSEASASTAHSADFYYGSMYTLDKNNSFNFRVRLVRTF